MDDFKQLYQSDIRRLEWNNHYSKLFSFIYRKAQCSVNCRIRNAFWRLLFKLIKTDRGIELSYNTSIGKGLRLMHAYNITINSCAVIGKNVDIYKGVTIGEEKRGIRKGAPRIGNCVWIGPNSTIVGKIEIGDDVLIAPNTLVNCNVPSHSIVIGCPCKVITRNNATDNYITKKV